MIILKFNFMLTIFNNYLINSLLYIVILYLFNFCSILRLYIIVKNIFSILILIFYVENIKLMFSVILYLCTLVSNIIFISWYKNYITNYNRLFLNTYITNNKIFLDKPSNISNAYFYEWLRGLVDGEGCFHINVKNVKNKNKVYFSFQFSIKLHKDDSNMLYMIKNRLRIGSICLSNDNKVIYYVIGKQDLLKIFNIFDKQALNTSKNLNYLAFKEAYYLWYDRIKNNNNNDLIEKILSIKNSVNRKRISFTQPKNHKIIITPYWLLGFIEGEGTFFVRKTIALGFGISQTKSELNVLETIKIFLLNLPGVMDLNINKENTKVVQCYIESKAKNERSKPMVNIRITDLNYIKKVLVPFLNNLTWFSKKEQDYKDWKIILAFICEGKHFTKEGEEVIYLINRGMNIRRLTTNKFMFPKIDLNDRIGNLLKSPSNYEIHENGKIFLVSKGKYLKGRGKIHIEVYNDKDKIVKIFNSIKECAQYFNICRSTVSRRLDLGKFFIFDNERYLIKRKWILP